MYSNYYWNSWYSAWGWFLWLGIFVLFFSTTLNWGYTYRAHRRFDSPEGRKNALDILNERYARGEITHEEYLKIKNNIAPESHEVPKKTA